ncbi:Sec-independent protein translocase protein TatB [Testudinibacter aquarius]|uniref:Sec-independent protein translocase protein TatB n=1 Tax=Testudinibacter aquarius TaxID=1524974 RepID=A0A4R3Y6Q1_9PAST|nr:Sec-independent protein translocase protein TatB [Testudinibacter aquarius]TCV87965.1 Sec-independent protein translocase TatB [Testudinibacter aquarius]TNG90243.1 Sec-independent protein translocase subunit TatB [Testudinibacter aquarius]
MFDIGFSELVLIFVVGLVVLGPQRLPVAIRTVVSWIRTIRGIATNVQNELSQELKLHELQESIKKAEKLSLSELSPELAKNIQDLKESAQKMQQSVQQQGEQLQSGIKNIEQNLKENALSEDDQAMLAEAGEPQLVTDESAVAEDTALAVPNGEADKIAVDTVVVDKVVIDKTVADKTADAAKV